MPDTQSVWQPDWRHGASGLLSGARRKGADAVPMALLGNNKIGDVGIEAFAQALTNEALAQLTTLHLGQNKITDKGFALLFPLSLEVASCRT